MTITEDELYELSYAKEPRRSDVVSSVSGHFLLKYVLVDK